MLQVPYYKQGMHTDNVRNLLNQQAASAVSCGGDVLLYKATGHDGGAVCSMVARWYEPIRLIVTYQKILVRM